MNDLVYTTKIDASLLPKRVAAAEQYTRP